MRIAALSDVHGNLPALDAVLAEIDRAGVDDDEEVAVVDSPLARWAEVLAGHDEQTVVLGHTHMPFARLAGGKMVVNPGSVGMPWGRTGAHWAILGPGVELRRTPYDVEAACAVIGASGYPGVEEWLDRHVRTAAITDDYALGRYALRDGRPTPPAG